MPHHSCEREWLDYNKDKWDSFSLDAVKTVFIAERETRKRARAAESERRSSAHAI